MARILVVDDEPDMLFLLRINLEHAGHEVVTEPDGRAALASVRSDPPDVLILDLMMPDIDGWAVLEEVKADRDERLRSMPIVMFTALGGHELQARGAIEGAVRWLTKPVPMDTLLAVVEES